MTLSDDRISELLKSYLHGVEVPTYCGDAVERKAASLAAGGTRKRRVGLSVLFAVLIPAISLAFTQPQVRHAFVNLFTPKPGYVLIRAQALTVVSPGCHKPVCRKLKQAWLTKLARIAPFDFVRPVGLPPGSFPCGYTYGSGLYATNYCTPAKKIFTILLMRYRTGEYSHGPVSTITQSDSSVSWVARRKSHLYLWVTGNELVMVNPWKNMPTPAEVRNIRRAMHGIALPTR